MKRIPENSVVDVFVDAAYGFVTLLIGTFMSLALLHIIIIYTED